MLRIFLFMLFVLMVQPAAAQQAPTGPEAEAMIARAIPTAGIALERYLELRRAEFAMLDFDGDGAVTRADVDLHLAALAAELRASSIGQILLVDLDGDGIVTRDEVREFLGGFIPQSPAGMDREAEARLRQQIEAEVAKRMRADLNSDGRITGAEMLAFAKIERGRQPLSINPMVAAALALDQDRDRRTTLAEFLGAAERVFRRIDADQDGTISTDEIADYRKQAVPPPRRRGSAPE
jgi:Ca2+-binding EF-hand superfamily protein